MTRIIDCSSGHLPGASKKTIQTTLSEGGVIGFPTTVYGLAALATDKEGCEKIYRIKGRSREKALILMSDRLDKIVPYLKEIPPAAQRLLEELPPGSITLVLPAASHLPPYLNPVRGSIGFRLADNPVTSEIMALFQEPLATTSANLSGKPPCLTAEELEKTFAGKVDLVLRWDGKIGGRPSTIVDFTGKGPAILREGSFSGAEIRKILEK